MVAQTVKVVVNVKLMKYQTWVFISNVRATVVNIICAEDVTLKDIKQNSIYLKEIKVFKINQYFTFFHGMNL